jgi:hypothetical protein
MRYGQLSSSGHRPFPVRHPSPPSNHFAQPLPAMRMSIVAAAVVGLCGRCACLATASASASRSWRIRPFILPATTSMSNKAAFVSSCKSITSSSTRESQCTRLWAEPKSSDSSSSSSGQRSQPNKDKSVKRVVAAAPPPPPLSESPTPKKSPLQRTVTPEQAVPVVTNREAALFTLSTTDRSSQSVSAVTQQPQPPLQLTLATISREELTHLIVDCWKYPAFRVNQVWHWIRTQGVLDVTQMTNVPAVLQAKLVQACRPHALTLVAEQVSRTDGTIKRAYQCHSDTSSKRVLMESVLMGPYDNGHYTACISSQAGCAQGCVFCATGQMGLVRQLSSDEIYEQVVQYSTLLQQRHKVETTDMALLDHQHASSSSNPSGGTKPTRLSNIVFMGMGEVRKNTQMGQSFLLSMHLTLSLHSYMCSLWPITTMSRWRSNALRKNWAFRRAKSPFPPLVS